MTNFLQMLDEQVIAFVDANFEMFASERDIGFPDNVLQGHARGEVIVSRCKEGFAIVYKGRSFYPNPGCVPADLLFLYVNPEFEGRGVGTKLIGEAMNFVTPGVPLKLKCEGANRMKFFAHRGFVVVGHDAAVDLFEMRREPAANSGL